nr:hypothetical protein [Tanacetum cinerariifolium]
MNAKKKQPIALSLNQHAPRNGDCGSRSQSDNMIDIPHGFIIHGIEVLKGNEKVMEVTDVENWRVDNSRLLRQIVSLFEWNSSIFSTTSSIQSGLRFRVHSGSGNGLTSLELEARVCIQRRMGQFARKLYGDF